MGFSAVAAFTRLYSMRVWRMAVSLAGAGVYIAIAYLTYDVLRYNGQVVIAASKVTAWILGGPYAMFAQLWFGDNFLVLILGGLVLHTFFGQHQSPQNFASQFAITSGSHWEAGWLATLQTSGCIQNLFWTPSRWPHGLALAWCGTRYGPNQPRRVNRMS